MTYNIVNEIKGDNLMNSNYEQKLNHTAENGEYELSQKFTFKDYVTMTIICTVCVALIMMGMGV